MLPGMAGRGRLQQGGAWGDGDGEGGGGGKRWGWGGRGWQGGNNEGAKVGWLVDVA